MVKDWGAREIRIGKDSATIRNQVLYTLVLSPSVSTV
jgi:hypothetical protein